jgi:hypothetical protein
MSKPPKWETVLMLGKVMSDDLAKDLMEDKIRDAVRQNIANLDPEKFQFNWHEVERRR